MHVDIDILHFLSAFDFRRQLNTFMQISGQIQMPLSNSLNIDTNLILKRHFYIDHPVLDLACINLQLLYL